MSLFIDMTRRPAHELLADLASCRQFRHLDDEKRQHALKETYRLMARLWMGKEATRFPDPNNLCIECGQPKSRHAMGASGRCWRCYASSGIDERDLWCEDVFEAAVGLYGFTCDACNEVAGARIEGEIRVIACRILENIAGAVKPILCPACASDFKTYSSRRHGHGAWRTAPARVVEKMALAWFAQKVKVLAERAALSSTGRVPE